MRKKLVRVTGPNEPGSEIAFSGIENALNCIRERAFSLFRTNAHAPCPERDWLQAERELFDVPEADLTEDASALEVKMRVPGFAPDQLEVAVTPTSVTVRGRLASHRTLMGGAKETGHKELFRRFEFPTPVDTASTTAVLDDGRLTIHMPRSTGEMLKSLPAKTAPASAKSLVTAHAA